MSKTQNAGAQEKEIVAEPTITIPGQVFPARLGIARPGLMRLGIGLAPAATPHVEDTTRNSAPVNEEKLNV